MRQGCPDGGAFAIAPLSGVRSVADRELRAMAERLASGSSGASPSEVASLLKECQEATEDIWNAVMTGAAHQEAYGRAVEELGRGCAASVRELSKSRAAIAAIWTSTGTKPGLSPPRGRP